MSALIHRAGRKYCAKYIDNEWWILWSVNPARYIGHFKTRNELFEWVNNEEKNRQHPSLKIKAPYMGRYKNLKEEK